MTSYTHTVAPEVMHPIVGIISGDDHPDCDELEFVPPTKDHEGVVPLGPLDHLIPKIWSPTIYPFENVHKESNFMDVEGLKQSLRIALDHLPILAGQNELLTGDPVNLFELTQPMQARLTGRGVLFGSSILKEKFQSLKEQNFLYEMLPPGIFFKEAQRSILKDPFPPILAIKVCHFDCGSVIMMVMLNHSIADGRSSFEFMKLWGQIHRNLAPDFIPRDSRHLFSPKSELTAGARELKHRWDNSVATRKFSTRPLKACCVTIDQATMDQLKLQFNTEEEWASSDDILSIMVWRALTRTRQLNDTPTTFQRTIDIRQRYGLDPRCFGNGVVGYKLGPMPADVMLTLPVRELARQLRASLGTLTKDYVHDYVTAICHMDPIGKSAQIIDNTNCDLFLSSFRGFDPSLIKFHTTAPALLILREPYYEGHFVSHPLINNTLYGYLSVNIDQLPTFLDDPELEELGFRVEVAPFVNSRLFSA